MPKIYYNADCDINVLKGKTVAIIGYGSQGHAHALNLRDSGVNVIVGLYKGSRRWDHVKEMGFDVMTTAEATQKADIIMMLTPDEKQADIYKKDIAPYLTEGKALAFAHGFNIHFKQILPPKNIDVFMIAPKAPGHTVRSEFVEGKGTPALVAVYQDASGHCLDVALAYGAGLGAARAALMETTFKIETETDLFGEQAVLCGGITELMEAGFETLVKAGYQPEMAYFETMHEMKLIVDLMNSGGMELMRKSVSNTAEYGDYYAGKKVITKESRDGMKEILDRIQDGSFADEFMTAMRSEEGKKKFLDERAERCKHQSSTVGAELRSMMSWLRQYN